MIKSAIGLNRVGAGGANRASGCVFNDIHIRPECPKSGMVTVGISCCARDKRSDQMHVRLGFRCYDAFRQASAVVFGEAVFPLEEVSDGLGLDAHLNAAQAGEQ